MGMSAYRVIASAAARMLGFPVADPLAGPAVFVSAGHRMFLDLTPAVRSRTGRVLVPRMLGVMEARSAAILRHLFEDPRLSVTRRSHLPFLRRVGRVLVRHRVPLWLAHALARPEAAVKRVQRIGDRLDRRLGVPSDATAQQRLDFVEHILSREFLPLSPRILPVAGAGFAALGIARKLLGRRVANGELHDVLRGVPHNVTTAMDLDLWRLATRLRGDEASARMLRDRGPEELARHYRAGTLPIAAQTGMAEFLRRYGHRAVAEIDLGVPRWSDDPHHLFGALANYLRMDQDSPQSPHRMFARSEATAEQAVRALAARCGPVRGWLVASLLHRTRQLAGLRELPKFHMIRIIAAARQQVALVGVELVGRGGLAAADDVYLLELAEVRAALSGADVRELVERRRLEYREEFRRRHVPRILLSDGTEPTVPHADGSAGELVGTPASAGAVTGTARVILDPVGAHLEPGEILVAPSTDPGWTPLFLTAGGLVMEMGGANSHGAVVAREYGIPAVVGLPDATSRITTGQQVTVDGTLGTVTLR
jgi:pyruvate,water dikinase